jgi:hypothetical protein
MLQTDANVRIGQPVDPMNLRPPALGDVKAIVAVALLLGVIGFALVEFPNLNLNFGFGADWECQRTGKGEPICIKKAPGMPGGPQSVPQHMGREK